MISFRSTLDRRMKLFNIWGSSQARPTSILGAGGGGGGGYCKAYIYPGEDSEENLIILLPKSYFKLHTFIHMHH